MFLEEELEAFKNVERILTSPRGKPPQINLIEGPLILSLSEALALPLQKGTHACNLIIANGGTDRAHLESIGTSIKGIEVKSPDLPAVLPPHSGARLIRIFFTHTNKEFENEIPVEIRGELDLRITVLTRVKNVAKTYENHGSKLPYGLGIPYKGGSLEITPGEIDFGRVPFWGDVVFQVQAPGVEKVLLNGNFLDTMQVELSQTENTGLLTKSLALKDGDYRYRFKLDDCVTLDPEGTRQVNIGPDGIFSVLNVRNFSRNLTVWNLTEKKATISFTSEQDWLATEPETLKISAGEKANVKVKIDKEKLGLMDFRGAIQASVGKKSITVPVTGALHAERGNAFIYGDFEGNTLKVGKCVIGKPLEIPLQIKTLGNKVIRMYAYDSLSGVLQGPNIPIEDPNRLQVVDYVLQVPTDFLMPHQRRFHLQIQTNCYLENLASNSFEIECEPVFLRLKPQVLDFSFVRRESLFLKFIEVVRSDGAKVDLNWQVSESIQSMVKINKDGRNRLKVEVTGDKLPETGMVEGDVIVEDKDSGASETVPCFFELITMKKKAKSI